MTNGRQGTTWRFLIVEDQEDTARQLREIAPGCVDEPDQVEVEVCRTFADATKRLRIERFDLLILDLKDDSDAAADADANPAGLAVFSELKKTRFIPVVFYTALAHRVRSEQTSFVRVVEKTEDVTRVREEIRRVLATKLPELTHRLEDLQRDYMWDFVSAHWKEFESPHDQAAVAYLLARRLALTLQSDARRMARAIAGKGVPMTDPNNIHPMELYVRPPVSGCPQAGDILKGKVGTETAHWLVLTPSCDFEQPGRLQRVLLAQCMPLAEFPEYVEWKADPARNEERLKQLIGDNRHKAQQERFKYLPGTYFLPDLVVDFQRLQAVPPDDLKLLEAVSSLDSPFAEAVLSRFSTYFGRLGTPDLDKGVVIARLKAGLPKQ